MTHALLSTLLAIQEPFTAHDTKAVIAAVVTATVERVAESYAPEVRGHAVHIDPRAVADVVTRRVSATAHPSGRAELPAAIASFDAPAMWRCRQASTAHEQCRSDKAVYVFISAFKLEADGGLRVLGAIDYKLPGSGALQRSEERHRAFGSFEAVLRRTRGGWAVERVGVLNPG